MERLTDNYDYCFLTCYEHEGDLCGEECPWYKNCHERLIFERLKHYENLEEQGRLVEVVKCKDCSCFKEIADAYNYYFCNRYGGIVTENDYCSRAEVKLEELNPLPIAHGDHGALSKEEAEAKLKELKGK